MISSGKTSTIYKVRRKDTNCVMAIKVLSKFNFIALESSAFTVEQYILERVDHPHIVSFYGSSSTFLYNLLEIECATDGSVYILPNLLISCINMYMITVLSQNSSLFV